MLVTRIFRLCRARQTCTSWLLMIRTTTELFNNLRTNARLPTDDRGVGTLVDSLLIGLRAGEDGGAGGWWNFPCHDLFPLLTPLAGLRRGHLPLYSIKLIISILRSRFRSLQLIDSLSTAWKLYIISAGYCMLTAAGSIVRPHILSIWTSSEVHIDVCIDVCSYTTFVKLRLKLRQNQTFNLSPPLYKTCCYCSTRPYRYPGRFPDFFRTLMQLRHEWVSDTGCTVVRL